MEIRLLKKLFIEGALISAKILPAPMESQKYLLVVTTQNGTQEPVTTTNNKKTKIYRRTDGAISDAITIGFKEVSIRFP